MSTSPDVPVRRPAWRKRLVVLGLVAGVLGVGATLLVSSVNRVREAANRLVVT